MILKGEADMKKNEAKVFKMYVDKNEKRYLNFYCAWRGDKKVYLVRVYPQFVSDYKLLCAMATEVESESKIESLL